jgi:hypothetical protein
MASFFCRYAPNRFGGFDPTKLVSALMLAARRSGLAAYSSLFMSLRSKPLLRFRSNKVGFCPDAGGSAIRASPPLSF